MALRMRQRGSQPGKTIPVKPRFSWVSENEELSAGVSRPKVNPDQVMAAKFDPTLHIEKFPHGYDPFAGDVTALQTKVRFVPNKYQIDAIRNRKKKQSVNMSSGVNGEGPVFRPTIFLAKNANPAAIQTKAQFDRSEIAMEHEIPVLDKRGGPSAVQSGFDYDYQEEAEDRAAMNADHYRSVQEMPAYSTNPNHHGGTIYDASQFSAQQHPRSTSHPKELLTNPDFSAAQENSHLEVLQRRRLQALSSHQTANPDWIKQNVMVSIPDEQHRRLQGDPGDLYAQESPEYYRDGEVYYEEQHRQHQAGYDQPQETGEYLDGDGYGNQYQTNPHNERQHRQHQAGYDEAQTTGEYFDGDSYGNQYQTDPHNEEQHRRYQAHPEEETTDYLAEQTARDLAPKMGSKEAKNQRRYQATPSLNEAYVQAMTVNGKLEDPQKRYHRHQAETDHDYAERETEFELSGTGKNESTQEQRRRYQADGVRDRREEELEFELAQTGRNHPLESQRRRHQAQAQEYADQEMEYDPVGSGRNDSLEEQRRRQQLEGDHQYAPEEIDHEVTQTGRQDPTEQRRRRQAQARSHQAQEEIQDPISTIKASAQEKSQSARRTKEIHREGNVHLARGQEDSYQAESAPDTRDVSRIPNTRPVKQQADPGVLIAIRSPTSDVEVRMKQALEKSRKFTQTQPEETTHALISHNANAQDAQRDHQNKQASAQAYIQTQANQESDENPATSMRHHAAKQGNQNTVDPSDYALTSGVNDPNEHPAGADPEFLKMTQSKKHLAREGPITTSSMIQVREEALERTGLETNTRSWEPQIKTELKAHANRQVMFRRVNKK